MAVITNKATGFVTVCNNADVIKTCMADSNYIVVEEKKGFHYKAKNKGKSNKVIITRWI